MDLQTPYTRKWRGWSENEAFFCPPGMPRWMFRVEQEEGMPIIDVIKRERSYGVSYPQIARSFGVNRDTLRYWVRKWGLEE